MCEHILQTRGEIHDPQDDFCCRYRRRYRRGRAYLDRSLRRRGQGRWNGRWWNGRRLSRPPWLLGARLRRPRRASAECTSATDHSPTAHPKTPAARSDAGALDVQNAEASLKRPTVWLCTSHPDTTQRWSAAPSTAAIARGRLVIRAPEAARAPRLHPSPSPNPQPARRLQPAPCRDWLHFPIPSDPTATKRDEL